MLSVVLGIILLIWGQQGVMWKICIIRRRIAYETPGAIAGVRSAENIIPAYVDKTHLPPWEIKIEFSRHKYDNPTVNLCLINI